MPLKNFQAFKSFSYTELWKFISVTKQNTVDTKNLGSLPEKERP